MSTSRGLNAKIRAYQSEHDVSYTTARRAVLATKRPVELTPLSLLIPFPDGPLKIAPGLSGDQLIKASLIAAMDHVEAHAAVAPARDASGKLIPPPVEHLRHHLALSYELGDETELLIAQSVTSIAVITALPDCWQCADAARYDVTVPVAGRNGGAGAYVCPTHYARYGSGTLGGVDGDTYLMLTGEVPIDVQVEVNAYMSAQGRDWVAFPEAMTI